MRVVDICSVIKRQPHSKKLRRQKVYILAEVLNNTLMKDLTLSVMLKAKYLPNENFFVAFFKTITVITVSL